MALRTYLLGKIMSSALYAIKIDRRQKQLDVQTGLMALNACCSLSTIQKR